MRKFTLATIATIAIGAVPAAAQDDTKPVTDKEVTAVDVVATPATDLNLKKDEIPALLITAQERPYTLRGTSTCSQLSAAIGDLDAVLGDDIDLPKDGGRKMNAGRVAQSVVGSFIPFRGIIREVSGANNRERELQAAIIAGMARRAFLKGTGQAKGCRYPARSATLDVYNRQMAELGRPPAPVQESMSERERQPAEKRARINYESRPVVQRY